MAEYTNSSSIAQVYYSGVWLDVCDRSWNIYDSTVVCRELGFSGVLSYQVAVFIERSSYYYYQFQCTGLEYRLVDCPVTPLANNQCNRRTHLTISCFNGEFLLDHSLFSVVLHVVSFFYIL